MWWGLNLFTSLFDLPFHASVVIFKINEELNINLLKSNGSIIVMRCSLQLY